MSIERCRTDREFLENLHRLAGRIEEGEQFEIRIARERIHVPASALRGVERERQESEEEIEFRIEWSSAESRTRAFRASRAGGRTRRARLPRKRQGGIDRNTSSLASDRRDVTVGVAIRRGSRSTNPIVPIRTGQPRCSNSAAST